MDFSGPDAIDNAIKAGLDIDGSPLPEAMLTLYREVMDQEAQRKRSGVRKSMRKSHRAHGCQTFQPGRPEHPINRGWLGRPEGQGNQLLLQLRADSI